MTKVSKKRFEHFERLVYESNRKLFYVSTQGFATSIDTRTGKKKILKKCIHQGLVRVSIHGLRHPMLKRLVWKIVHGDLADDWLVECIDGDETNCNYLNLRIISKTDSAKISGPKSRSRAVIVQQGEMTSHYRSVREAAKGLFVSYQTLLDYLDGKVKCSVLMKRGRRISYDDVRK